METLKELEELLAGLSKGKNTKINVHFSIPEPLLSFCVDFNRAVNAVAPSLFGFNRNSIAFPHLTLFMGFVNSHTMLERVFQIVENLAKELHSFRVIPMQPYFKGFSKKSNQYLFVDMLQNDEIASIKGMFLDALNNRTIPIGWNLRGEKPHISIACYRVVTDEVRHFIESHPFPPECDIRHIGVSISGQRGTCLGQLKTFELK